MIPYGIETQSVEMQWGTANCLVLGERGGRPLVVNGARVYTSHQEIVVVEASGDGVELASTRSGGIKIRGGRRTGRWLALLSARSPIRPGFVGDVHLIEGRAGVAARGYLYDDQAGSGWFEYLVVAEPGTTFMVGNTDPQLSRYVVFETGDYSVVHWRDWQGKTLGKSLYDAPPSEYCATSLK